MADKAIDTRGEDFYSIDSFVFPRRFRDDVAGVLIPEGIVKMRAEKMARQIFKDFSDSNPLIVPMLDGATEFYHDLFGVRHYTYPRTTMFLTAKSYAGDESTGSIKFPHPAQWDAILKELNGGDRPIVIVEDIVDTGRTLGCLIKTLVDGGISRDRIKIAALISKPCRRLPEFKDLWIDYLGFVIDDHFIVGHGLDFDDRFRELKDICVLKKV